MTTPRIHGGPDAAGPAAFDFSTNANACGPCPTAVAAVQRADARHYPDPQYRDLRDRLAARHRVAPWRVLPAASGSEAILRITARAVQRGVRSVALPEFAYGDYRHAAAAWGLPVVARAAAEPSGLAWACDPSSPLGQADPPGAEGAIVVLDRAYAPLRLEGTDPWTSEALDRVWQLWTPNKALGLTGIRAAYCIAPDGQQAEAAALDRLAPSWAVGSHGVAMLDAWCDPAVDTWMADSLRTLRGWKDTQLGLCRSLGWRCLPSEANFFVADLGDTPVRPLLARLRAAGIQARDCASFGLPGHLRLGVLPPTAQQALRTTIGASPH